MSLTSPATPSHPGAGFPGMAARIRSRLVAYATPRATAVAVALYLASIGLLTLSDINIARHAPQVTKPDLIFGYSHAQIVELFTAFGDGGRQAYAINLVIDTLMPLALLVATLLVIARATPRWLAGCAERGATHLLRPRCHRERGVRIDARPVP
jgi:hypothetical protein